MTYPLIGNYGMSDEDYETKVPTMGGMIAVSYTHLDVYKRQAYGHMGREDLGVSWEKTDMVDEIKKYM